MKSGALDKSSEEPLRPLESRLDHWSFLKKLAKVQKKDLVIGLPAAEKSGQGSTTPATRKRTKIAKDLTISWFKEWDNWKGRVTAGRESDLR